jgi:hypothetical protein
MCSIPGVAAGLCIATTPQLVVQVGAVSNHRARDLAIVNDVRFAFETERTVLGDRTDPSTKDLAGTRQWPRV